MSNECKQDKKVNFIPRKLVIYFYEFVMQDKQQQKKAEKGNTSCIRGQLLSHGAQSVIDEIIHSAPQPAPLHIH